MGEKLSEEKKAQRKNLVITLLVGLVAGRLSKGGMP
jgi:hypothetical protein